jgi:glutamyl-tRNA reductase
LRSAALFAQLREKLQHTREDFLRRHTEELKHLAPEDRERVARLTVDLLDSVLEKPASRLRGETELRRKLEEIEAVRHLFGLDKDEP